MASTADEERRKGKSPMSLTLEEEASTAATAEKAALLLVAEDGVEVRVSLPAARLSQMLLHMVDDEGFGQDPIRIPCAFGDVLRMVVEYCEKHAPHYTPSASGSRRRGCCPCSSPPAPVASSAEPAAFVDPDADPNGLEAWDKDFLRVDKLTLFQTILAANYMNIQDLLDLCCRTAADMLRGRTPEEIIDFLDVNFDY